MPMGKNLANVILETECPGCGLKPKVSINFSQSNPYLELSCHGLILQFSLEINDLNPLMTQIARLVNDTIPVTLRLHSTDVSLPRERKLTMESSSGNDSRGVSMLRGEYIKRLHSQESSQDGVLMASDVNLITDDPSESNPFVVAQEMINREILKAMMITITDTDKKKIENPDKVKPGLRDEYLDLRFKD